MESSSIGPDLSGFDRNSPILPRTAPISTHLPPSYHDANARPELQGSREARDQTGYRRESLDVSDPDNLAEVGFFDSVPWTDAPGFDGSGSNYPFFERVVVVFTSRNEGLFVVREAG